MTEMVFWAATFLFLLIKTFMRVQWSRQKNEILGKNVLTIFGPPGVPYISASRPKKENRLSSGKYNPHMAFHANN